MAAILGHVLLLCALWLTPAVRAVSRVTLPDQTVADIDALVTAGLGCHQTPGLAIAVVRDGQVVVSKGYGVEDMSSKRPVTSSTLFGIASLTKAFTATLLVKLLEGRSDYKVSTNVYKILGKDLFNNTLRSTYATLEDLLAHRMGIPRHGFLRLGNFSRSELVRRVKYLPSHGAFRDSFYYSDLMYGLLTQVIEQLGNASWEDQVQRQLFDTLGMKHSTFDARLTSSTPHLATPYVIEHGKLEKASLDFIKHWGALGGSGTVVSSAEDMAKWMLFHLSGGHTPGGGELVGGAALNDTYKARNSLDYLSETRKYFTRPGVPVTMSNDGYGLGWKKGYYRGLPMLQHSGSTWGYRSLLTLLPDRHVGVFSSMTGEDEHYWFRLSLHAYLADVMLGETPWINASTICSFPAPWERQSASRHAHWQRQSFWDHAPWERQSSWDHAPPLEESPEGRAPFVEEFAEPSSFAEAAALTSRAAASHAPSAYTGRYHNEAYGDLEVTLTSQTLEAVFGFGKWELHTTSTPNRFKAVWVKDPPLLDFTFDFRVNSAGQAFSLTVPGFESSDPPVFFRVPDGGVPFG